MQGKKRPEYRSDKNAEAPHDQPSGDGYNDAARQGWRDGKAECAMGEGLEGWQAEISQVI